GRERPKWRSRSCGRRRCRPWWSRRSATSYSGVEEEFARRWGSEPREGWTLIREGAVLHQGQKVFVPDFAFRHRDGRSALLEIVGFWTPEYLEAKAKTLRAFADHRVLLAVGPSAAKQWRDLPVAVIRYKARLRVGDVLQRLRDGPSEQWEAPP